VPEPNQTTKKRTPVSDWSPPIRIHQRNSTPVGKRDGRSRIPCLERTPKETTHNRSKSPVRQSITRLQRTPPSQGNRPRQRTYHRRNSSPMHRTHNQRPPMINRLSKSVPGIRTRDGSHTPHQDRCPRQTSNNRKNQILVYFCPRAQSARRT
jgi:hypothetical protein